MKTVRKMIKYNCWRWFAICAKIIRHSRHGLQIRASGMTVCNVKGHGLPIRTSWSYGHFSCLAALLLVGCISVFVPPDDMKEMAGLLVVDGVILEEGTRITLSRTVKLNEENLAEFYLFEDINHAKIHVIDENLNTIAVATQEYSWGPYIVKEKISFVPGMKYALDIQTSDFKHYRSAFVTPMSSPEIDSVSYQIKDGHSIDFFVSTHDPTNQTNCFMWDFEEVWEIRSKYFMSLMYDLFSKTFSIPQSLNGDNRHYCWASDYSKSLMVASSQKYTGTVIRNHKIHSIQPGTSRYSYLYCLSVRQYGLDDEAYLYFENLQKNLDEGGSLFAPQPSEIAGNIECLSDPEVKVIGYIFASKASSFRLYVPMAQHDLSWFEDQIDCSNTSGMPDNQEIAYGWGLGLLGNEYIRRSCLDCTMRGGSKIKPDYWPNDHQ